ncbi:MAG: hypothetical protein K5641_03270, partial [Lachnospiraceae bacterium]|nr:hypothetical protein [Lachnospiraceae bacterium]
LRRIRCTFIDSDNIFVKLHNVLVADFQPILKTCVSIIRRKILCFLLLPDYRVQQKYRCCHHYDFRDRLRPDHSVKAENAVEQQKQRRDLMYKLADLPAHICAIAFQRFLSLYPVSLE